MNNQSERDNGAGIPSERFPNILKFGNVNSLGLFFEVNNTNVGISIAVL